MKKKVLAMIMAAVVFLAACDDDLSQEEHNTSAAPTSNNPYSTAQVGDKIQLGGFDWLVLAVQDGRALVLSDNVLENRQYYSTQEDITWEHSTLRKFLNSSFYNTTFSEQEKEWIAETTITNSNNPEHGTPGGKDTLDKVFLLSIDEVERHMGDDSHINGVWWLRSPGYHSFYAACVHVDGYVYVNGIDVSSTGGVRPALWLNL
jgi:hypothetical protein